MFNWSVMAVKQFGQSANAFPKDHDKCLQTGMDSILVNTDQCGQDAGLCVTLG